jgi:hypothetical protein
MASQNIEQIFTNNPITSNASTDLMYFGQSPYGPGNDAAITFANFSAQFASFPSTSTSNQVLLSVASSNPAWSTATYPGTITINEILYASAANIISGLASANSGVLITSASGVPSISQTLPTTVQINITELGTVTSGIWEGTTISVAQGGTAKTSVTSAPAASSWAGWDANENLSANNFLSGYSTTVTAAATTTLTVSSAYRQYFTGTTTQTVKLPVTSTLKLGFPFFIVNNSTGSVTIESSGSNTITTLSSDSTAILTCILTSGTSASSWNAVTLSGSSSGSPVWTQGTGTDSGIGGDGTATAGGNYSLAYGNESTIGVEATDNNSFAFGTDAVSDGLGYNFSFGTSTTINGSETYTLVFGNNCSSGGSGNNFVFGGGCNISSDFGSFVFGGDCNSASSSGYNFVFGSSCAAGSSASGSFAMGKSGTSCNGVHSFAFGLDCDAKASYSHAVGNEAIANNAGSVVWGDSNASPTQDYASNQWQSTFEGGYFFNLSNSSLAVQIDSNGNLTNVKGIATLGYTISVPSSGGTVTLNTEDSITIINPSGTLATLTIDMPPSPVPGQVMKVSTTQIITALTVSGNGHSIISAPTSLSAGQAFSMIYDLGSTTWYPA